MGDKILFSAHLPDLCGKRDRSVPWCSAIASRCERYGVLEVGDGGAIGLLEASAFDGCSGIAKAVNCGA